VFAINPFAQIRMLKCRRSGLLGFAGLRGRAVTPLGMGSEVADLAQKVVETIEKGQITISPTLYTRRDALAEKNQHDRHKDLPANAAVRPEILNQLKDWERAGLWRLPVCMAKDAIQFHHPHPKPAARDRLYHPMCAKSVSSAGCRL